MKLLELLDLQLLKSVGGVGSAVTRGFSDVGYALRDQTCNLDKSIDGVGVRIIARLDASEKSAMQDKINALQTQLISLSLKKRLDV